MPALLTHYCFATKTLSFTSGGFPQAYYLGNQGPDVFMAYGMIPWHKRVDKKEIYPVGAKMHHTKMVDCYMKMVKYAYKSEHQELLLTYVLGLFAHYALDRLAHPYIFYRSGFDRNGELHGFYKWSHGFFEALLDKVVAKETGNKLKPYKVLLIPKDQLAIISKMWEACCPYPLKEDSFALAQQDFVSSEKLIQGKTGLKRPIFKLIQGRNSAAYAQSMPPRMGRYARLDVANGNHATWEDPCSGEPSTSSIYFIMEVAKADFSDLIGIIEKVIDGTDISQELTKWEANLDHDGTPYDGKKTHQKLCWEEKDIKI